MSLADFALSEFFGRLGRAFESRLRRSAWLQRHSAGAADELEVPFGYAVAFEGSLQAVEALEGTIILSADEDSGVIVAELPGSWKTRRGLVEVRVRGSWDGRVSVAIQSRPVPPQLYDWGESKKAVEAIRDSLTRRG